MKKFALCIALALVLVLGTAGTSMATGICLDNLNWCNDYYLNVKSEGAGIYSAHGYEYGCGFGYFGRSHGTLLVTGGMVYIGLTTHFDNIHDFGALKYHTFVIDLDTKRGAENWNYVYQSSSTLSGHGGGPDDATMTIGCSPPTPGFDAGGSGADQANP
jgi:hypothetical protein